MSDSQSDSGRRRFLKGTGVAAVSMGLAGCSGGGSDTDTPTDTPTSTPTEDKTPTPVPEKDYPEGGTYTFGMNNPVDSLNILATNTAYADLVLSEIHGYGTTVDPVKFEVHPSVFTDWTFEELEDTDDDENEKPDVRVKFNVREGLTWNDGEEFSIDDVVFSYNFLLDANPGAYAGTLNPIVSVQKGSDDWDVHMRMDKPIGTYASSQLQLPILPEHKWGDVDPGEFQQYEPQKNGGPVGLGPGVITKYEPDTATEISYKDRKGEYKLGDLEWMDDVNGLIRGGPFLDAVRFKIYGSEASMEQALLQGELDTIYSGIRASKIPEVEKSETLEILNGFDTGYGHYSFNLRNVPFDDLTFRQVFGFAFDDVYWTQRLQRGYAQEGDFIMPPGYVAVRPESAVEDAKILDDPASQAFTFRQAGAGVPDVEGIRKFLTEGKAITGEGGTYVGQEYPGSLTGVKASGSGGKHDYTFGEIKSQVLKQNPDADKEIYVDGKTITEINGGPITMYVYPAKDAPQTAKMVENYIGALQQIGIPVDRQVMSFNTMIGKVYSNEDFDVFPMGWVNLSIFATGTLYGLFHSDNADDLTKAEGNDDKKNTDSFLNNPMGYGLFEDATADKLISDARTELETEKRNSLARKAVERIYLDFPTMVESYDIITWPANTSKWAGYLQNIPGPGSTYIGTQFSQIHKNE
jgi:peptide/nickel transport system substrate-binding protein